MNILPFANHRRSLLRASWLASALLPALAPSAQAATLAFPGAEGFGALATGGRGGKVVHVTNLNDAGAGSLRDAVSQGDRIVVFDVGGLITIGSQLVFAGDNLTVLGQTAPAPGITVYGDGTSGSGRKNLIVRYLRLRQGIDSASGDKALNVTSGSNMIFDHVSVQWGRWDTIGITGTSSSITIQHSLMGESIDPQRFGGLVDSADKITLSNNLWIDSQSRSPKFKANGQYINNVVYNWGANGLGGGHSGADWYEDLINNVFIKGPSSTGGFATGYASTDRVYNSGNVVDLDVDGKLGGRPVVAGDFQGDSPPTFESGAHNAPPVPVTVESPTAAYARVVEAAGASLCRDPVDLRLIAQLTSLGTKGGIVLNESLVGGQPAVVATKRPAGFDSDNDGIADAWESAHGLNPNSATDGNADSGDGYSNLEKYASELASSPAGSCGAAAVDAGASNGPDGASPSKDASAPAEPVDAGAREGGVESPIDAAGNPAIDAGSPALPTIDASDAGTNSTDVPSQDADPAAHATGCGCRIGGAPALGGGAAGVGVMLSSLAAILCKRAAARRRRTGQAA